MIDYEGLMEKGRQYTAYRNRHDSHSIGSELYYYCKDVKDYRRGVVYTIIDHQMIRHYVLEVYCHVGEFLVLQSQYQVRTKEEINE